MRIALIAACALLAGCVGSEPALEPAPLVIAGVHPRVGAEGVIIRGLVAASALNTLVPSEVIETLSAAVFAGTAAWGTEITIDKDALGDGEIRRWEAKGRERPSGNYFVDAVYQYGGVLTKSMRSDCFDQDSRRASPCEVPEHFTAALVGEAAQAQALTACCGIAPPPAEVYLERCERAELNIDCVIDVWSFSAESVSFNGRAQLGSSDDGVVAFATAVTLGPFAHERFEVRFENAVVPVVEAGGMYEVRATVTFEGRNVLDSSNSATNSLADA